MVASGNIETLMERAQAYAENGNVQLNTGHLLLAVLTGKGAAAKTLSIRGLSETKVRTALRSGIEMAGTEVETGEPSNALSQVVRQASKYSKSFGIEIPSAIHVLAAIAAVKSCYGYQILVDAGLNTDTIRNQALRNMTTGLTREHGFQDDNQLQMSSTWNKRSQNVLKPKARETVEDTNGGETHRNVQPPRLRRRQPAGMGQTLEQVQRKTQAARLHPLEESGESISTNNLQDGSDNDLLPSDGISPQRPALRKPVSGHLSGFRINEKEYPHLSSLGRNLTQEALDGHVDTIVGRVGEMEQIMDVLNKRKANCPCLVGPPGVGKTAVIEGLAHKVATDMMDGSEPMVIIEARLGDLLGGTSLRGALSEKIEDIKNEISHSETPVVLFFDDIHALLSSNDAQEAVTELKAVIGRGEMPCIAATTDGEYGKYIASDPTLARLFTVIDIAEPSEDEAMEILRGIAPEYAHHHGVEFHDDAVGAAVKLSNRYVPDSTLPDKAVGAIDLAGARVRRRGDSMVTVEDVAAVLAKQIGVPVERLSYSDKERLLYLEDILSKSVVGHKHVLQALGETLRRNAAGFRSGRPIGSFLFLGPTGVGKTETAKALAKLLFADEAAMVRLDMSEFSEAHAVARVVGAPPGYVGHEDGGQLTEAVRKRPYSLVLLDEIEKSHRDVVQILLQVLDDGRLTDGKGKTVNFENTVIVMTSNLGADMRDISESKRPVGFGVPVSADKGQKNIEAIIESAARDALPPELWNRIDEPLVFAPLTREEVGNIATLMLDNLSAQLEKEKGICIHADEQVIAHLVAAGGFDVKLGARPMRRTIQRLVEGPVARIILAADCDEGDTIRIGVNQGELTFQSERRSLDGTDNTGE